MPGCSRLSIDLLLETAKQCRDEGVCGVALFPCVPDHLKTKDASERHDMECVYSCTRNTSSC